MHWLINSYWQRGQVLWTATLSVLLLLMALVAATQLGEHSRRQWYLQTVADDAAYSGATLMARHLNLSSLLNRALIGNQIAMAQWLGLASWLMMIRSMIMNVTTIGFAIPGLQSVMASIRQVMHRLKPLVDNGIRALITFHGGVIKALSLLQQGLDSLMITEIVPSVMQVVDKHDPSLQVRLLQGGSTAPFPSLLWTYSDIRSTRNRTHSNDFKELTLASRDPFTESRSYQWVDTWLLEVNKAGGNELQTMRNGSWNWNALDAVQIKVGRGMFSYEIPFGWASRAVYRRYWQTRGHPDYYGDAFAWVGMSADLAWANMERYRMLQPPFSYARLRNRVDYGANALVVQVYDSKTQQTAQARAEVRYSRPTDLFPRDDNKHESGNLFNALWRPQLVPLTLVDKSALAAKEWLADG